MTTMAQIFSGTTADDVWRKAALSLSNASSIKSQASRLGPIREYLHCSLVVQDPIQRWIQSRLPAINPAFAVAEVVWLLAGRNDAAFLNFWNPALPKFAGDGDRYHGAYGYRLRHVFAYDQLVRAFEVLLANPDSRQVVLQIWHGPDDMPTSDGKARDADIPCNVVAMPKVREGRLEWLQVMRSNDLYLGTPHNFVQFTTLQEVLAGWLDLAVGSFVLVADSLHLYEHDLANCGVRDNPPTARNSDSLALSKKEFDRVFPLIVNAMDELRGSALGRNEFKELLARTDPTPGWRNLFLIVAADAARRRGWDDEMGLAIEQCTNPVLISAWAAWQERCLAASQS